MNKLMAILLMTVTMSGQVFAARTGQEGGGGDASDERVSEIRSDLLKWISDGGARELIFPKDISYGQYVDSMTDILQPKKVIVEFTNDKVLVKKVEKTCRGYIARLNDQAHIQCNILRFKETSEAQQYRLIHHEYAGLVNVERNQGALSDYEISSQVTDYLEVKSVLRLAVKKIVKKPDPVVYKDDAEKICNLKKDELEKKQFEDFEKNVANVKKGIAMINNYYKENGLAKITSIGLIDAEESIKEKFENSNINKHIYRFRYKVVADNDSATILYNAALYESGLSVARAYTIENKDKLGRITSAEINCSIIKNLGYSKLFGRNVPDIFDNNIVTSLKNEDTNFVLSFPYLMPFYEGVSSYYTIPR